MSETEREPHLFDDATEEELMGFSHRDLVEYVKQRGFAPKTIGTKASLVALILAKRAESVLPMDAPKPEGDEDDDGETEDQISPAEARKLDGASDDTILDWLERHPDARQCLVDYANNVLTKRAERRRKQEAEDALKSDLGFFRVTKGGRLAIGGLWTTLPVGSAVSAATHNLDALRAQGIELEAVRGVRTGENQVGLQTTVIDLV